MEGGFALVHSYFHSLPCLSYHTQYLRLYCVNLFVQKQVQLCYSQVKVHRIGLIPR